MKRKLYVDATSFVYLTQKMEHFSGIQRTEYELFKRFVADDNLDASFVVKNTLRNTLVMFNMKLYLEHLRTRLYNESKSQNITPKSASSKTMKYVLKVLRKMYLLIPGELKAFFGRAVQRKAISPYIGKKLKITDNDLLLVSGVYWLFKTVDTIIKYRKRFNFSIFLLSYDLIPVVAPQMITKTSAEFTLATKSLFENASEIITYSKSNAEQIANYLNNFQRKTSISTFQLGSDKNQFGNARKPDGVKDNFILMVGSIELRKNIGIIYYAYKTAKERGLEMPQLVLVGAFNVSAKSFLRLFIKDPELKDWVLYLRGPSDAELGYLYQNCMFTIFPSLFEGWGLPITESLENGKFCLSSNSSSLPEVGQGLTECISPYDSALWAERINYYFQNDHKLREMEENISNNYQQISWDDSYQQFKALLLKTVLNDNDNLEPPHA